MKDRTLKLLNELIASDFPISIATLADEFKLSQRTIRNEVTILNDYLLSNSFSNIQTIRGKGIQLSLDNMQKKELNVLLENQADKNIYSRDERILDLILSIALGSKKVFLYQKEKEYQISKSTLDEDMRRIRATLKEYGIEVVSIPKQGLGLEGKERIIRTMLYSLINKSVDNLTLTNGLNKQTTRQKIIFQYIPLKTLTEIDYIYDQSISSSEENLYRNNIVLFTSIWLTRYRLRYYLRNMDWDEKHNANFSEFHKFVKAICSKFDLSLERNEFNYLVFMLNTFNSKDMNNSIEWLQAQILAIQLIQHVENTTNIPFSRKEETLHEGLYKHLGGLLNRMRYDIQFTNPLKENIKESYGFIYKAVAEFSEKINKIVGKKITEDEIAFLTIHFSTSVSELNQEYTYCFRAVVICNHGIATGKLLAESLQESFNIEILAVLSSRETDLINKLDVDLVFSTLPVDVQSKPLLVINPIIKKDSKEVIQTFLNENFESLRPVSHCEDSTQMFNSLLHLMKEEGIQVSKIMYEKLEGLFKENHLSINKREIQPMIKDVLKDKNIIVNAQADGWENAIEIVAEPLLKEKAITDNYVRAMINTVKEYGPYIVIGEHLALAHARPEEGVKKLSLSVATLKEPIRFGHDDNDPVKIIFCLSAIDSFSHLNIMKNLIELINDENRIERLAKASSVEEFKAILFE